MPIRNGDKLKINALNQIFKIPTQGHLPILNHYPIFHKNQTNISIH